ncbi:putative uncharacterized protein [Corynebacterium casei UCMA 3821]|uniref:Uncharacterized protein n=1 Tax=Corynebacterium casei UCMA 3821 TaxID=1110505 RepID=G7HZA9_9CORY|nr:putative uncharacterized protein [Corynebacterium casei UCMA 3821]
MRTYPDAIGEDNPGALRKPIGNASDVSTIQQFRYRGHRD